MRPLSSLGIGLSLVFGFLFLALIAELYYLLWWKKRINNREIEEDYSSSARELFYLFCWKRPSSLSSTVLNSQQLCNSVRITDAHGNQSNTQLHMHSGSSKDLLLKPFGEDGVETELVRLHSLSGPSRFLFTIKEETKEDLESEDGKSRGDKSRKGSRSRSLSDLLITVETPYLTPLSSPPFFTPPLTPMDPYSHHGFNPLFESSTDAEVNGIRSSPPPKLKFLKDAEEKLHRRKLREDSEKRVYKNGGYVEEDVEKAPCTSSMVKDEEEDGSFITIIVGKNKEKELHHYYHLPQYHSSSSQLGKVGLKVRRYSAKADQIYSESHKQKADALSRVKKFKEWPTLAKMSQDVKEDERDVHDNIEYDYIGKGNPRDQIRPLVLKHLLLTLVEIDMIEMDDIGETEKERNTVRT
ncbi:hypothetical protein HHK36_018414 [Tetracentron sinense]|uniref:Uncharacterized protein n=1 Tax=Tetracentron sinense TaxID=13715 RepID=A0A835DDI8_TETSI|nr:hypothetical protein HHK36_018414 [Tetracentron sinense]